jgi:hypothetical protein
MHNAPHKPPYSQRQYTPLPTPIDQLYEKLLRENRIVRRPARIWDVQPTWFVGNKTCDLHSGERGHDIFTCPQLRGTIERLIKLGNLKFAPLEGPNVVK